MIVAMAVTVLFLVQRLVDMHGLVFVVNNLVDTVGMWLHDFLLEDDLLLEWLCLVNGLQDGLALWLHHRFNPMLRLHIHGFFHILGHVLVAMVVVVTMVVAVIIVAVGFHHVPVLPVHDVLILDIHGHMFDHVTSVMCIHVLSQSVVFAPIFVQIAVVFSTVFVSVMIAVMRIAIMARVGIPMPCAMKIVAIPVRSMTINLMTRVIINTATMVTVIVVVLDHNFLHLLV